MLGGGSREEVVAATNNRLFEGDEIAARLLFVFMRLALHRLLGAPFPQAPRAFPRGLILAAGAVVIFQGGISFGIPHFGKLQYVLAPLLKAHQLFLCHLPQIRLVI